MAYNAAAVKDMEHSRVGNGLLARINAVLVFVKLIIVDNEVFIISLSSCLKVNGIVIYGVGVRHNSEAVEGIVRLEACGGLYLLIIVNTGREVQLQRAAQIDLHIGHIVIFVLVALLVKGPVMDIVVFSGAVVDGEFRSGEPSAVSGAYLYQLY